MGELQRIGEARGDPAHRLHVRDAREHLPRRAARRGRRGRASARCTRSIASTTCRPVRCVERDVAPATRAATPASRGRSTACTGRGCCRPGVVEHRVERDDVRVLEPREREVLAAVERRDLQDDRAVGQRRSASRGTRGRASRARAPRAAGSRRRARRRRETRGSSRSDSSSRRWQSSITRSGAAHCGNRRRMSCSTSVLARGLAEAEFLVDQLDRGLGLIARARVDGRGILRPAAARRRASGGASRGRGRVRRCFGRDATARSGEPVALVDGRVTSSGHDAARLARRRCGDCARQPDRQLAQDAAHAALVHADLRRDLAGASRRGGGAAAVVVLRRAERQQPLPQLLRRRRFARPRLARRGSRSRLGVARAAARAGRRSGAGARGR